MKNNNIAVIIAIIILVIALSLPILGIFLIEMNSENTTQYSTNEIMK